MTTQLSVIIPVLNELEIINHTLDILTRLPGADECEFIIVDGNPSQNTIKAISNSRVIKLHTQPGRGIQMNRGAAAATGRGLLFLHADTQIPENGLEQVIETLTDETIVGGAFELGIDAAGFAYRLIEYVASARNRLTRIPFGDQGIFMKRDYFKKIGGYKTVPIMEDVDLMRRAKKDGQNIRILRAKVQTSPRRWRNEGILFCTLRNWTLQFFYGLGVSPSILARFYR